MNVTRIDADLPDVTVRGPLVLVHPATFDLPLVAISAVVAALLDATRGRGPASRVSRLLARVRDPEATITSSGAGVRVHVRVRVGSHGVLTLDEAGDLAARLTTAYNDRRGRVQ